MQEGFHLFGAPHMSALGATAVLGVAGAALAKTSGRADRFVRLSLALALAAAVLVFLFLLWRDGLLHWRRVVPLQICDFAILLAIAALVTRARPLCEILYFWALTGTLLAMVMPAVSEPMHSPVTAFYFLLHGLVVVSAAALTWGSRVYPKPGAPLRVLAFTIVYAACVAVVNVLTGSNFLFLRARPAQPTLLDYFGPWPIYLFVVAGVALALFVLLERVTPAGADDGARPRALSSRR